MTCWFARLFGSVCYVFLLAFSYLIGFVGNLIVPKSVDTGASAGGVWAVMIDLMLIALFGILLHDPASP